MKKIIKKIVVIYVDKLTMRERKFDNIDTANEFSKAVNGSVVQF